MGMGGWEGRRGDGTGGRWKREELQSWIRCSTETNILHKRERKNKKKQNKNIPRRCSSAAQEAGKSSRTTKYRCLACNVPVTVTARRGQASPKSRPRRPRRSLSRTSTEVREEGSAGQNLDLDSDLGPGRHGGRSGPREGGKTSKPSLPSLLPPTSARCLA